MKNSPDSQNPCVRNCCLDEQEVCLGCGRTLVQVLGWRQADENQRARWLSEARQRCRDRILPQSFS